MLPFAGGYGLIFFFDRYAMGAKKGPSWWLRTMRAYPSFSVTQREKDGLCLGGVVLGHRGGLTGTS